MTDSVERRWHAQWLALTQKLATNDSTVELNERNHRMHKTHSDEQRNQNWSFERKSLHNVSFGDLMTRRPITFGRIVGDAELEKAFLAQCEDRFAKALRSAKTGKRRENGFWCADIPKVIHQIWLGDKEIPSAYREWSRSWRRLHPKWEFVLWTDDSLSNFEWASPANRALFGMARNYGERSDILRLEVLHRFGGVCVDFDFEAIRAFDAL